MVKLEGKFVFRIILVVAVLSMILAACTFNLAGSAGGGTSEPIVTDVPIVTEEPVVTEESVVLPTDTETPTETPLPGGGAPAVADPDLSLQIACNPDTSATFFIINFGGDMVNAGSYTVNQPGIGSSTYSLQLAAGERISFDTVGDASVLVQYATSELISVSLAATGECIPPTPTPTVTKTFTPSWTASSTKTPTPTKTTTSSKTPSFTPSVSLTPSNTFTPSNTLTPSNTFTPSSTFTPSNTSTPSNTPTPSSTPSTTFTPSTTYTPSNTSTPSNTRTPTYTRTPSNTKTPTNTRTSTSTKTLTPTKSLTPTVTDTPTITNTPEWDKSSITVSGKCLADGSVEFTITNTGTADMTGPTSWTVYVGGAAKQSGTVQLAGGASQVFTFGPYSGQKVEMIVQQRPGHPGLGQARADATCSAPSKTPTFTRTITSTATYTYTHSTTYTPSNTRTYTPTKTSTVTRTPSNTPSLTNTPTITYTPTNTLTPTPTSTSTATLTALPSPFLALRVTCNVDLSATFTIINLGTAPVTTGHYTVNEPSTGNFSDNDLTGLGAGEQISFRAAGNATVRVEYTTARFISAYLSATGTCLPQPSKTPTQTRTTTSTVTPTSTFTPSATFTPSSTPTSTPTYTSTKVNTATFTPTFTPTSTATSTPTATVTVVPPKLTATGICTADTAEATFTITNNGGEMPAAYTYTVKDSAGNTVKTGTFKLGAGASATVQVTGTYGVLTLSITDDKGTTTTAATTTCVKMPKLTATGTCELDTAAATFVITNSGGDMPAAYTYTVKDGAGAVLKTGTFQLKAGASTNVLVTGTYGVLTLSITDDKGTTTAAATTTCVKLPKLTATGLCTTDTAEATFTITNNGGDMPAAYTYTIKDSAGTVVKTGTFQLKAGASTTVTVTGTYGVLTLSITDDKGTTTTAATTTCVKLPKLIATGTCEIDTAAATFVITNSGGDMPVAYTYAVKDSAGTTIKSGTIQLKAGASMTVTVSGTYGVLTLSITDDTGTTTTAATTTCVKLPKLTATGICTADTAEATFTITNNGGDMSAAYTYTVKDSAGITIKSGAFKLGAGASTTVQVTGTYGVLTLTITDDKGTTTTAATTTCVKLPKLTATGICEIDTAAATFIITNSGGDMPAAYTYAVKDSAGTVVKTGTFQLKAGASTTVTVTGTYGVLTLSITDDKGTTTEAATTTCIKLPKLSAIGTCEIDTAAATFVITNNGGDMLVVYTYTVKDSTGTVVKTGTFQLKAGANETVAVSGTYGVLTLTITDDKGTTTTAATTTCVKLPKLTATGLCTADTAAATFVITNSGGDMSAAYDYTVKDGAGAVLKTGTFQLKAGGTQTINVNGTYGVLTLSITDDKATTTEAATTTCIKFEITPQPTPNPAVCPQFIIFHTFRDQNLEIYRLDGVEGAPDAKLVNLTRSASSSDSRPSRSPNDAWVAYQSNRDGNVELYFTDSGGSAQIRLTHTTSNNINPMFGPNNSTIAFQSDRNGNWDIFTIDRITGVERQLTSDTHDDVNPFWSPDLRWLTFQSNRNGTWGLFLLDTETGNEYSLVDSAASEINPLWSPNGKQIAYLSDAGGTWNLHIVDIDGKNDIQITNADGDTVNATWSPEGYRIAYQSTRNGNVDVYSYDVQKKTEYRVTSDAGADSSPTWDCGGSNLSFTTSRSGNPDIFSVPWAGGAQGALTIHPATDKWSEWSPAREIGSRGE